MQVSRRALLFSLFGVPAAPRNVQAQPPSGFSVTGVVTESDQDDSFFVGWQFGFIAAPRTEPHRILRTMLGSPVRVHVERA